MSTEATLSYDGPLSTYQEWDALLYGLTVGFVLAIDRIRRDAAAEPSKVIGGAIVGYAIAKLL